MIVYSSDKKSFNNDVISNNIENIVHQFFIEKLGFATTENEIASWKNSMLYMNNVLLDDEIPDNAGITIEYQIQ